MKKEKLRYGIGEEQVEEGEEVGVGQLLQLVDDLYTRIGDIYTEQTGLPPPAVPQVGKVEVENRHKVQSEFIVQVLQENGMFSEQFTYIEFGAGKGLLSQTLQQSLPSAHFILIERESRRSKKDKSLSHCTRIRADIADVNLESWQNQNLVGIGKHICGGATDLSIISLRSSNSKGFALTTCCHHQCSLDCFYGYSVLRDLQIGPGVIKQLFRVSSWACSGPIRVNNSEIDSVQRTVTGFKVKRILDMARVLQLLLENWKAWIETPWDFEVSPENSVIVALRQGLSQCKMYQKND